MKLEDRITSQIYRYGEKYIGDEDNVIALELCYLVHQEFEKVTHQSHPRKKRKIGKEA
jgi:hypothetical protein